MSFATGPRRIATFWPDTAAARAVGVVLAAITAAVLLAFVAVFGVNRVTPIPAWKEFVDIGAEGNLPTWWNATLLALVGAGAAIAAVFVEPRLSNPLTRSWIVVAVAGTYLSIDEAAGLHERFGRLVDRGSIEPPTYAWILPGALLAVAGAAVLVTVGRHLPSPTSSRLGLGLAAYALGAIGFEALTGWIRDRGADWLFTVGITVEETLEMGSAAYVVIAIVDNYRIVSDGRSISLQVGE